MIGCKYIIGRGKFGILNMKTDVHELPVGRWAIISKNGCIR